MTRTLALLAAIGFAAAPAIANDDVKAEVKAQKAIAKEEAKKEAAPEKADKIVAEDARKKEDAKPAH